MSGILKFKTAIQFMLKSKMTIDAINYHFILRQLGLYNNFTVINEELIYPNLPQKNEDTNISQSYQNASNDTPALILYSIFSDSNHIQSIANLLIRTEEFYILEDYTKRKSIFNKRNLNICLKD